MYAAKRWAWKKPKETLNFGCAALLLVLAAASLQAQHTEPARIFDAANPGKKTEARTTPFFALPAYLLRTYAFADSVGNVRLEVRFGLVHDVLQFTRISAACYRASYEANLAVFDTRQACVASRTWKRDLEVDSFPATNDRAQLNLEAAFFRLPPGTYQLHAEIVDLHTQRRMRRQYPLPVPDLQNGKLQLSALVLGEVAPDHNGALVIVDYNLPALLEMGKPRQHLYYEIYGARGGDRLTADFAILDTKSDTLAAWNKTLIAAGGALKCCESLDDKIRRRGAQTLHVQVKNLGQSASARIDYKVVATATDAMTDFFDFSSELRYAPLRYISSEEDYRRILAAHGARRDSLIAAFWQQRDPTPETADNELQNEFYRRVALAEASFAAEGAGEWGWQADRGRIYIIYGPPREVRVRASEPEKLVYEIWLYPEIERRFIFRERDGSGRFELINR